VRNVPPAALAATFCSYVHGDIYIDPMCECDVKFCDRRTVVSIPNGPSELAVKEAAWGLARYAAISQVLYISYHFQQSGALSSRKIKGPSYWFYF